MSRSRALALLCVTLSACGGTVQPDEPAGAGSGGTGSAPDGGTTTDGKELGGRYFGERPDEADYLFDDAELRTYELVLLPEALAFLDAAPADEIYVEGALRFEGTEIGPVGIRYKGSVGAWLRCTEGFRTGAKICDKLSMKVKINWESDAQLFYGLKKLQFHSMNNDGSMMRERLGYQVFREMGVPAPRAVHARLVINGVYQGVFVLVEQIDGRFTRSRFSDGKGNLYKEVWPLTPAGSPESEDVLEASLATNEDGLALGTTSVDRMRRFGEALAAAPEGDRLRVTGEWLELGHMMRYVATDRALLNDDGVFHWYTSMGPAPHNFFWYEEASADRLYLVPWDLDAAMRLSNPITSLSADWDEKTNDCQSYELPGPFPLGRVDAACDPLLGSLAALQNEFLEHTATLLDGPFSEAAVNEDLARWSAQIEGAVTEAKQLRPASRSFDDVQVSLGTLRTELEEMRRRLRVRLGRE